MMHPNLGHDGKGVGTETVAHVKEEKQNDEQKLITVSKKTRLRNKTRTSRNSAIELIRSTTMFPFKYNGQFMCFYCPKQFLSMPELAKHVGIEHEDVSEMDIKKSFGKDNLSQPVKVNILNCICKLCGDDLKHFEDLERHLINTHAISIEMGNEGILPYKIIDEKFVCVLCEEDFRQYRALNKHMNEHYAKFKCNECDAGFATVLRLNGHLLSHEKGSHKCDRCARVFNKITSLKSHIRRTHLNIANYKCTCCEQSFKEYEQIQKHFLTAHGTQIKLRGDTKTKVGRLRKTYSSSLDQSINSMKRESAFELIHCANVCPFKFHGLFLCFYCSMRFEKMPDLVQHFKLDHKCVTTADTRKAAAKNSITVPLKINVLDNKCKLCDVNMSNFENLKQHLIDQHKKQISIDNDFVMAYRITETEFICVVCERYFDDFRTLSNHLNEHWKYVCDQCGAGFASKFRLRSHMRYHESGTYACEECGKVFNNHLLKNQHVQSVHIRSKKVKCTQCTEIFETHHQRKKHMIIAHGAKPKERKCRFCPKIFYTTTNVRAHERRTHLIATSKFICDICNYKAFSKFRLASHMISHSGVKAFKCEVCYKMYSSKKCLKEHMKIHNNVRNYVCQFCDKAFVQSASLKCHLKTHHKNLLME